MGVRAACLTMAMLTAAEVDIHALFARAELDGRVGTARKTLPVDARSATPGEVVVSVIAGEGKETQSPPARAGAMAGRGGRGTGGCATGASPRATRRSWSRPQSSPSATRGRSASPTRTAGGA